MQDFSLETAWKNRFHRIIIGVTITYCSPASRHSVSGASMILLLVAHLLYYNACQPPATTSILYVYVLKPKLRKKAASRVTEFMNGRLFDTRKTIRTVIRKRHSRAATTVLDSTQQSTRVDIHKSTKNAQMFGLCWYNEENTRRVLNFSDVDSPTRGKHTLHDRLLQYARIIL